MRTIVVQACKWSKQKKQRNILRRADTKSLKFDTLTRSQSLVRIPVDARACGHPGVQDANGGIRVGDVPRYLPPDGVLVRCGGIVECATEKRTKK